MWVWDHLCESIVPETQLSQHLQVIQKLFRTRNTSTKDCPRQHYGRSCSYALATDVRLSCSTSHKQRNRRTCSCHAQQFKYRKLMNLHVFFIVTMSLVPWPTLPLYDGLGLSTYTYLGWLTSISQICMISARFNVHTTQGVYRLPCHCSPLARTQQGHLSSPHLKTLQWSWQQARRN